MDVKFNQDGLVPAIAQDVGTGEVLMLAYMNEEALRLTKETGIAHYYSRSRQALWKKGETSGHIQEVKGIYYDCDGDAVLLKVNQIGAACHTGNYSCFFNEEKGYKDLSNTLKDLYKVIIDRKKNPQEGSYTQYLFDKGIDKILKKIGEEAAEVIIGAKNDKQELIYEASDLIYHLMVLLVNEGVTPSEIMEELRGRMK
ncbi:MAG: bifunctional phosphoribosyl-AMP cyclohydrolase/phosphoribosyl-ATP diphosphatase HisIE [Tissierellia bacterium]|jgi:phosphoribosyl-ATP pyrophosphohydrolase/phosphoribosyl-AMP cyclohydrolase|nr:bifunctional phosphoribosyl-AMP cyclohydrolase/phosphoribosyl-ATP diphosphatase HisIE [Tissierellia bacterium]